MTVTPRRVARLGCDPESLIDRELSSRLQRRESYHYYCQYHYRDESQCQGSAERAALRAFAINLSATNKSRCRSRARNAYARFVSPL